MPDFLNLPIAFKKPLGFPAAFSLSSGGDFPNFEIQMEPMEESRVVDVVCGVIRDPEGRYLACRRPADKHLGGLWEFPGGKVDPGESPETALARELREELEIDVEVGGRLADVNWKYETVAIRLMPFFCRILSGEPRPVEHTEICWCPGHAFAGLDWAPADLPVLDELIFSEFLPE